MPHVPHVSNRDQTSPAAQLRRQDEDRPNDDEQEQSSPLADLDRFSQLKLLDGFTSGFMGNTPSMVGLIIIILAVIGLIAVALAVARRSRV